MRYIKWLGLVVASLIVLFAVLISAARIAVPLLNNNHAFFEKWVSRVLHQPVRIAHVTVGWSGFNPRLQFNDVTVTDLASNQTLLQIKCLAISINLLQSMMHWQLLPGRLFISGTQLDIYQNQRGQLRVKGVSNLRGEREQGDMGYMTNVLSWLLTESQISLQHIDINFHTASGRLLPISNLRLKVTDELLHRQIAGVAALAQTVATQFRFVVKLQKAKLGAADFRASIYFKAKHLVFNQWFDNRYVQRYFKQLRLIRGQGNIQAWLIWRGNHISEFQSKLSGQDIALVLPSQHKNIAINRLSANMYWQLYDDGWSLSADHVQVCVDRKICPEHTVGLRVFDTGFSSPFKVLLTTRFVRLHDIHLWAEKLGYWSHERQKAYATLKPRGELHQMAMLFSLARGNINFYRLRADFSKLAVAPWHKFPGVTGLAGSVDITPTNGQLKIIAQRSTLSAPYLFQHILSFNRFDLTAHWIHSATGWNVNVPLLAFSHTAINFRAGLTLTIPATGSSNINLSAKFNAPDVRYIRQFIPAQVLHKKLKDWLCQAFRAGQVTAGQVVLVGPLNDFPFDNNQGKFIVATKISNLNFAYLPHWPMVKQVDGSLTFRGRSMVVNAASGNIAGNPLDHITATIPDLQHPVLTVLGHSASDLSTGTKFLHRTPLQVGKQLVGLNLSGPMQLDLKLHIPLYQPKHMQDALVASGTIITHDGTMQLLDWNTQFKNIHGIFHFNNNNLTAQQVTATQFGLPAVFDISTLNADSDNPVLQVEVGGQIRMTDLGKQLQLPVTKYLQGRTTYRGLLTLHDEGSAQGNTLSVVSDLKGIAVTLPPPYAKPTATTQPTLVKIQVSRNRPLIAKLQYGKGLSMVGTFTRLNNRLHFIAGMLHLGEGEAQLQSMTGLLINGKIERLGV